MTAMLRGGAAAPIRRNTRRELRHVAGRFRGGKLVPVGMFPLEAGESAVIEQDLGVTLDTIAGKLITPVLLRYRVVFASVQSCDALLNASDDYAGVTEVIRQKVMNGETLFDLEEEGEITKRAAVVPASYSGTLKVSKICRIAYNAAVNHLRQRLYTYATLLDHSNTSVVPALLSSTVLQRLNGALDPDPRINGQVQLEIPDMQLPVSGIGRHVDTALTMSSTTNVQETSGKVVDYAYTRDLGSNGGPFRLRMDADKKLDIYAELNGLVAGGVSLTDFYNAEKQDKITRRMRELIEANPEDGEEAVLRWALGLNMEAGRHPVVVAEREVYLNNGFKEAMDGEGILDETQVSVVGGRISIRQAIPATELGGVLVCLAEVKPDEVLESQPHPILSRPWKGVNHIADEMKLDPVKVLQRELSAEVETADEAKVAFYTGHNELLRAYVAYGYNRQIDLDQVETKNTLWQYAVPTAVTPENINYPEDLDHYPFLDQDGEVVNYDLKTSMIVSTPTYFGPTPVEKVAILDDEDLFGDGPVAESED